jgi:hypothetical protein
MSDWSPEQAITKERRHILEGEKRVSRQEALLGQLIENGGRYQLVHTANEVLVRIPMKAATYSNLMAATIPS